MELIDVSRDWFFFFVMILILILLASFGYMTYKDRDARKIGSVIFILTGIATTFFICDFFLTEKHYIYTYKVYDWNIVMKGDFIIESQTKDIVKLKMR